MIKLTVIALVLSFAAPTLAAGQTDIVRIDGTVFKAPDTRPASRVKDREHPTKRRTAKVKETAPSAEGKASPPTDAECIIIDEVIDLPDGRTVIRKAWLCERPLKDKKCAKYTCKRGECHHCTDK